MNLYKISQKIYNGYDTYDSAVVCAKNEAQARRIHPSTIQEDKYFHKFWDENRQAFYELDFDGTKDFDISKEWADHIQNIEVVLIGKADQTLKQGVVIASYNAG